MVVDRAKTHIEILPAFLQVDKATQQSNPFYFYRLPTPSISIHKLFKGKKKKYVSTRINTFHPERNIDTELILIRTEKSENFEQRRLICIKGFIFKKYK